MELNAEVSQWVRFGLWNRGGHKKSAAESHLCVVAAHISAGVALVVVIEFLIHPLFNGTFHAESRRWIPSPDVFPNRWDVRIGKNVHATVWVVFKHTTFRPRFRNSGQAVVPRLKEAKYQIVKREFTLIHTSDSPVRQPDMVNLPKKTQPFVLQSPVI